MKRRQALLSIAVIGAGAALLPGCQSEQLPIYERIPLDRQQRKFLDQFSEALLPLGKTQVKTPEKAADFILTVLNDCHSPEDIQQYLAGLSELQGHVKTQYKTDFGSLDAAKQGEVFQWLSAEVGPSATIKFFYEKTRGLGIEHLTSSEFFLKNVTDWEFAPGYFKGCVNV